jgi:Cytochrome c554 and c-prime
MKLSVGGYAGLMAACAIFVGVGAANAADHMFIGAAKCAMCHKTATQGEQYPKWQASPHAKAYETLAGDKAKEIAKAKGIADPQKAPECLKCHVTAAGVDAKLLGEKYAVTDGVECESCHGAGGDYSKMATMKGLISGTIDPKTVGFVLPDKATCEGCHNGQSPTFKEFDFDKMAAKIAHPIPAERKAQYKTAN